MGSLDNHPNGGTAADGLVAIVEAVGSVCGYLYWKWLDAARRRDAEWEEKLEGAHLRWTRAVVEAEKHE